MRPIAALVLALVSVSASAQAPAPGDVVVNEISYDPPAPQPSTNEWVEVVNRSSAPVDLAGVRVVDSAGGASAPIPGPLVVPPGGFAVLVRNGEAFAAAFPGVAFTALGSFPTLNNSGDTVRLVLAGTDLDAVPYTPAFGGNNASTERRDPDGPSDAASNFGTTSDPAGGTPGRANSLFAADTAPPGLDGAEALDATTIEVTFTEPVTAATAAQAGNYVVSESGTPAAAVLAAPSVVRLTLAAPLAGPATFTLTVTNVADAAGNVLAQAQTTFFFGAFDTPEPRDIVINEILYDPPQSPESPFEWVELFNRTSRTFDLAALRFADAASALLPIASTPTPIAPGEYVVIGRDAEAFASVFPGVRFVQVAGFPALNNGGDRPAIVRADSTVIDAVAYGSRTDVRNVSLERRDPDAPSVAANFLPSVAPAGATPGARNSTFAPDRTGPQIVAATASPDGRTVTVTLDEPADPASVTPAAFTVAGAPVTAAVYDDEALTVALTLATPLTADATVTATGLRDGLGNATATTSAAVAFTPDAAPPGLTAFAETPTTVRVVFTEPVTRASAGEPAAYRLDGGIGAPASVGVETEDGFVVSVLLTFAAPLAERQVYTLTATGITDRAGNVTPAATARLLVGQTDAPGPGDLVVTEIMFDPQTGQSEYLELLNTTAEAVFGLRTVSLDDGDPTDADLLAVTPALVLPGDYVVVARDGEAFAAQFPGVPFVVLRSLSLSNSGEAVVLRSGGVVTDSVFYDPDWHRQELDDAGGIALERRDPAGPSNAASNWSSSLDERGGTPGAANTVSISPMPVERGDGITVTSPFAPDDGEAARVTYTLEAPAALVRVRLFDGGGRVVRELEDGRLSGQQGAVEWDGTDDSGRRLRAGIYVVLLEAVDTLGGTTEAHRAAIVLARR